MTRIIDDPHNAFTINEHFFLLIGDCPSSMSRHGTLGFRFQFFFCLFASFCLGKNKFRIEKMKEFLFIPHCILNGAHRIDYLTCLMSYSHCSVFTTGTLLNKLMPFSRSIRVRNHFYFPPILSGSSLNIIFFLVPPKTNLKFSIRYAKCIHHSAAHWSSPRFSQIHIQYSSN